MMILIYQTSGALFSLLFLASFLTKSVQYFFPQFDLKKLQERINAWWLIMPPFLLTLLWSKLSFFIFLSLLSFMAFKEFISVISTRLSDRATIFLFYCAIPLQYFLIYQSHFLLATIFIPSLMLITTIIFNVWLDDPKGYLSSLANIFFGAMLCIFCVSAIGYLHTLPTSKFTPTGGLGAVIFLVVLCQLNDVAQYISGKLFGKQKILPHLSPNKTWVGFTGGVLITCLLSTMVGRALVGFTLMQALVVGLLISVSGFIGDVNLSAIKRDLGIKDFDSLIKGHGGILDRIDSLTLAAPLFLFYLKWIMGEFA